MNPIVNGISRIRNSILYSIYLSISILALQLIGSLFKNLFFQIIILVIVLAALALCITLIIRLYSGIRILRKANLIKKLNQRLDEAAFYFNIVIGAGVIVVSVIIIGAVLLSSVTIIIGMAISFLVMIFSWLFMLRLIQINGILGVYAKNKTLTDKALSVKSLFYLQIGASTVSYIIMFVKTNLGQWHLAVTIPIGLFSIYYLFIFISMLNQTIKVYSD